ncbi:DUF2200 family protein [Paracoccus versutus]
MNPARSRIKGRSGGRVEGIEGSLMQEIRCLDELVKGKPMEKILRDG